MSNAELCVIFNPAAGKRRAGRRLEALRRTWGRHVEFQPTRGPGHAEELAGEAVRAGFGIVAAAGGDGTVHEVANGILHAGATDTRFGVIPIGSANDYAYSLKWDLSERPVAADLQSARPDDNFHLVDVGRVQAPGKRERYFVCCLGLGLNGAVTLESRRIRRLQGLALYGLATLRALWYHYGCPDMNIAFDGRPGDSTPTLMLSVLVGRREGGFVLAPAAKLDDGWLDFVQAGNLSRWEVLRFLPRLALAGPPTDNPKVRLGQCRQVVLQCWTPLTVHIDGEFFSVPEDGVHDLEIQIVPKALRVGTMVV